MGCTSWPSATSSALNWSNSCTCSLGRDIKVDTHHTEQQAQASGFCCAGLQKKHLPCPVPVSCSKVIAVLMHLDACTASVRAPTLPTVHSCSYNASTPSLKRHPSNAVHAANTSGRRVHTVHAVPIHLPKQQSYNARTTIVQFKHYTPRSSLLLSLLLLPGLRLLLLPLLRVLLMRRRHRRRPQLWRRKQLHLGRQRCQLLRAVRLSVGRG